MNEEIAKKAEQAVWAAKSLFERGKTAGSTANLSFRHEGCIYISGSGTCFGTLKSEDFAVMDMDGNHVDGPAPSKEYPLHRLLYEKKGVGAVIHVHSFYATLWSCLKHPDEADVIPGYTPYLKMKTGRIGLVPYAPPGSRELFQAFEEHIGRSEGYLLQNHGPVIGASDILSAFYSIEELEESARIAWHLRHEPKDMVNVIPG